MQRKYKTKNDVNSKQLQVMIDQLEHKTKLTKKIGDNLNARVKDYTLLRLTFEF
jgi:hypothetical protein